MLNADAADGVLLLNEEAPERIRALTAMADAVGRINEKTFELVDALRSQGGATRPSDPAARMDRSLRFERAGAQRPQEEGPPSPEALLPGRGARRDRPRPRRAAGARRSCCANSKHSGRNSAGMERLWRGTDSDPSRIAALIKWAGDLQAAVDAFQVDGVPPEDICSRTSRDFSLTTSRAFAPAARSGRAFETMHQAFPAMHQAAKELGACIGLDRPEEIIRPRARLDRRAARADRALEGQRRQGPAMGDLARGCEGGA